ncbi:hypothetical protein EDD21DRAFT_56689 [Dissophora ornata]|nr:hypothetical protein EDD21DRAFT_56689 [Dissophora ornata]
MESNKWPEVASRSVIGSFYSHLVELDKSVLNHLSMGVYPKWARRVIHAERQRRKNRGNDDPPTRAEKGRILTFGEGLIPSQEAPGQQTPAPASSTPAPASSTPTLAGPTPTLARPTPTPARPTPTRLELDGEFLHVHVSNDEAPFDVAYDRDLYSRANRTRSLAIFGSFVCLTQRCNRNKWVSGIVATSLEFCRQSNSYKTTLFAQKCRKCDEYAEPTVDESSYARKVVWTLSLWKGLREREEEPLDSIKSPTGPHDFERCYACKLNKCPWKKILEE